MLNPLNHPVCYSYPLRAAPSAWMEHVPFAMLLVDLLRPKTVVELGTYYGTSYCAFCQAVRELQLDTKCYAVDTWQGDAHQGAYGPEVLADLKKHHDPLYAGFSRLVQSDFDKACTHFSDGSIDLLHIDGYHVYDAVKADYETWLPKLSRRGVVLFHDINVREFHFGVWKLWEELKTQYASFEFTHEHGLGMLAVGPDSPAALQSLLELSESERGRLREFLFQLGQRHKVRFEGEQLLNAEKCRAGAALQQAADRLDAERCLASAALQQAVDRLDAQRCETAVALQQASDQSMEKERIDAALRERLAETERELQVLAEATREKDRVQSRMEKERRAAANLLKSKEHALQKLQQQAVHQTLGLQTRDARLSEIEREFQDARDNLERITSSRSWRMANKLRGVRRRMSALYHRAGRLPHLSKRLIQVQRQEGFLAALRKGRSKIGSLVRRAVHSVGGTICPQLPAPESQLAAISLPLVEAPATASTLDPELTLDYFIGVGPACLLVTHVGGGGTERHVQDMAARLEEEGVRALILRPVDAEHARLERYNVSSSLVFRFPADFDDLLQTLEMLDIRHVHVHHLMKFSKQLRRLIDELGQPYDFTIHDYYTICPRVHLTDPAGNYCREPDVSGCNRCVRKHGGPYGMDVQNVDVEQWRSDNEQWLRGARTVYVPDADVSRRMSRYFPEVTFAERPHFAEFVNARPVAARRISYEPLRVAVLGTLTANKGLPILIECVRDAIARQLPLQFHLIGLDSCAELANLPSVKFVGEYAERSVFDVLDAQQCHCSFFPATAPETFSYTLSIALAGDLYPLAFDLGALATRINDLSWGVLLPMGTRPADINDRLTAIGNDLLQQKARPAFASPRYNNLWQDYYGLPALNEDLPLQTLAFRPRRVA